MKTTMMFRSIANPRRTKLADLADDRSAQPPAPRAEKDAEVEPGPLPTRTANPRRTVVTQLPNR